MTKAGERLLRSARQALDYARGETDGFRVHTPEVVDVKAIRTRLKLTQREFAEQFGFELGTLRHWEQRRRQPEGPARVLLKVIAHDPEAVKRALAAD